MAPSHLPGSVDTLPGRIAWACGSCGQSIRAGLIHIDLQEATRRQTEMKEWEGRARPGSAFDLSEVLTAPYPARWGVSCDSCHRGCAGGCYEIGLEQCQSAFALIRWTAHLYGKSWFGATDWIDFIHRVARENGAPSEPTGVW